MSTYAPPVDSQALTPADVVVALDVLRAEHRDRAVWCDTCQRRHIRTARPEPWVDVDPARIPASDRRARDLVADLLDRLPTYPLGDGRVRVLLPTGDHAVTVAAHLRKLGTPAHAIRIGEPR